MKRSLARLVNASFPSQLPAYSLARKLVALDASVPDTVITSIANSAALVDVALHTVRVDCACAAELTLDFVASALGEGASAFVEVGNGDFGGL